MKTTHTQKKPQIEKHSKISACFRCDYFFLAFVNGDCPNNLGVEPRPVYIKSAYDTDRSRVE